MATRIYTQSSGSVGVTPSTWNFANQVNPVTVPGTLVKNTGSTLTSKTEATGTTNPTARAMGRTVIGPLAAQTISGTIKGQMRGQESNAGANATMAIAVKIVQPGGTDRAVLLAQTASDSATVGNELLTALTNAQFKNAAESASITLTSQSATAGDYLVIEWGFRSATGTTRNITLRYGNASATDLPENATDTNDYNPWWEFSANLTWQAVTEERDATATGAAAVSTAHAAILLRDSAVAPSVTVSSAGAAIVVREATATSTTVVVSADALVLPRSSTVSAETAVSGDGENADTGPDYQERDATASADATTAVTSAALWQQDATATAATSFSADVLLVWAADAAATGSTAVEGVSGAVVEVSGAIECGATVDGQVDGDAPAEPQPMGSGGMWGRERAKARKAKKQKARVVASDFTLLFGASAFADAEAVLVHRELPLGACVPTVAKCVTVDIPAPAYRPSQRARRKPETVRRPHFSRRVDAAIDAAHDAAPIRHSYNDEAEVLAFLALV